MSSLSPFFPLSFLSSNFKQALFRVVCMYNFSSIFLCLHAATRNRKASCRTTLLQWCFSWDAAPLKTSATIYIRASWRNLNSQSIHTLSLSPFSLLSISFLSSLSPSTFSLSFLLGIIKVCCIIPQCSGVGLLCEAQSSEGWQGARSQRWGCGTDC